MRIAAASSRPYRPTRTAVSGPPRGHWLLCCMRILIGHDLDGAVVHVDTADGALVLLVGDPGDGKTTLSRHLARCWCADPQRTARAFVEHPHQYRDLPIEVHALTEATTTSPATTSHQLTIIDGADHLDEATLRHHGQTRGPSIITSF